MVTISTSEIKRFLSHASNIAEKRTLPILSYVKVECNNGVCTLTKTNLDSYCVVEVEAKFKKDQIILIDRTTLEASVIGDSKEVKISIEKGNVILDNGSRKPYCQVNNDPFPAVQEMPSPTVMVDDEMVAALKLSKAHIFVPSEGVRVWQSYIFSQKVGKKHYIYGVSGAIMYFKKFNSLPEMVLEPEIVSVLEKFDGRNGHDFEYSGSEQYHHFRLHGVTFGFRKTEMLPRESIGTVIEKLSSPDGFLISKSRLIETCQVILKLSSAYAVAPSIVLEDAGKDKISAKYVGVAGDRGTDEIIPVKDKTFTLSAISFHPKNLLTVLKSISGEEIRMERVPNNMAISCPDDPAYVGSVVEVQPINA